MLKHLHLSNIILVENAEITFQAGLNVLSGETGSGKSAILHALGLIAGDRADIGMIRNGTDRGVVEAIFDIDSIPAIHALLNDRGIDHEAGDDLIIRRELAVTGKSRAFVNNQSAQLGLLKELGELLVDIVGQHANQRLLSMDKHRDIVDLFGELEQEAINVKRGWSEEQNLRKKLNDLIQSEAQRLRDIEICQMELTELQDANLKENEDDEAFVEYTLLANAEELTGKVNEICEALTGERNAALPLLVRQKNTLEQLVRIDPTFEELSRSFDNALIELQEVSHSLDAYQNRIEHNPSRLEEVNERLTLITRLKRKYGTSVEDVRRYQIQAAEKLERLQNADDEIEAIKLQLQQLEEQNNKHCAKLSKLRKASANSLEKAIVKELRALNMPKVVFDCVLTPQPRNHNGDERIEFFLTPNIGEKQIPIKECASGGELSRVMLALQTLLAGKEKIPTLIFDEIDGNIGGETAVVVGEQLLGIGKKHQVLCITHFPQVAKQAQHHLQISKQEKSGRTVTIITALDATSKPKELARMLGS